MKIVKYVLKLFKLELLYIEIWITDQDSKPLEIRG